MFKTQISLFKVTQNSQLSILKKDPMYFTRKICDD